jgi:hypothetical protein
MERLGREETKRTFFNAYILYLMRIPDVSENVLVDSAILPNVIQFEFARISYHNVVISRETILIYVVELNTALPV